MSGMKLWRWIGCKKGEEGEEEGEGEAAHWGVPSAETTNSPFPPFE